MSILTVCLYAVIFIVALLLIVLILIQPSKSGGMGAAFGGIGESVFGGKAGSHLTKGTVIMTTIFFIAALALAAVIGHEGVGKDEELRKALVAKEKPVSGIGNAAVEESRAAAADNESETKGAETKGAETKGAETKGAEAKGAETKGAETKGAEAKGADKTVQK